MRSPIFGSARGFSVLELLMVVTLVGILSGIAIGVTPGIVRAARGEGSTAQVTAFLKRMREVAISRRRNIEIRFVVPNQVQALQLAVPDPPAALGAPLLLETLTFEGGIEYRTFAGQGDTPDLLALAGPIGLGGPPATPVMFTSEGSFVTASGDPIGASIFLGVSQQPLTSNAINILGPTAAVRPWRWNGREWVQ